MKSILSGIAIVTIFSLTSCGGTSEKGSASTTDSAKSTTTAAASTPAAAGSVPTMTVNEADWEVQDLSKVAPLIHISMKVPKGAKMEKNGNGGVDIHVSDFYTITVSALAISSVKEGMDDQKSLTINNKNSYMNGKALTEEDNGMVYTEQMNTEANGTTYQPEVHFAYFIGKPDGAFYSVTDVRPLENFSVPGSAYTADIANKIYAIVKGSAKENKS